MILKPEEKEKKYLTSRWDPTYTNLKTQAHRLSFVQHALHFSTVLCTILILALLALPNAPRAVLIIAAGLGIVGATGSYVFGVEQALRSVQGKADALLREKVLFESSLGVYADSTTAFAQFVNRSEALILNGVLPLVAEAVPPSPTGAAPLNRFPQPTRTPPSSAPNLPRPNPFAASAPPRLPTPTPAKRTSDPDAPSDFDFDDDDDDDALDEGLPRQSPAAPFPRNRPSENPFARSSSAPFGSRRGDFRTRFGGSDLQKGDERSGDLAHVDTSTNGGDGVHFAANYPKEMREGHWQPLNVYAYLPAAAEAVAADLRNQRSTQPTLLYKRTKPPRQSIPEGAIVTATPCLKGFQFNPLQVSIGFYKDWHRFDFEMRTVDMRMDQAANGYIAITVDGILVADLPLSVYVNKSGGRETDVMRMIVRKPNRALFASYSLEDQQIEARLARVSEALGLYALRDAVQLKVGGDPQGQRLKLLQQAGVFQLFWSHAAANSSEVRHEWQQALPQFYADPNFIRIVYWQQPMPPLPDELRGASVSYQPELSL